MTRKKILASVLSVAMITAIAVPAWASVEEVAVSEHPNLTAVSSETFVIGDPVNYTEKVSPDSSIYFAVCGATKEWKPAYMTAEEAADVQWSVLEDSVSGVSIELDMTYDVGTNEYVSIASVNIASTAESGLAVVEASNSQGGYMDFSVLVNGSEKTSVNSIGVRMYDGNGTEIVNTVCDSVSATNYYGNTTYPSVLDCPLALMSKKVIANYNAGLTPYATHVLYSITLKDNTKIGTDGTLEDTSWLYRVYKSNGEMHDLSEKVGMDDFALHDGDIVVMKYGTWGTTFPERINVN